MADINLTQDDIQELLVMLNSQVDNDNQQSGFNKTAKRLARIGNIGIYMTREFTNHNAPHFHVRINSEKTASFCIDPLEKFKGTLDRNQDRIVLKWAEAHKEQLKKAWDDLYNDKLPDKFAAIIFSSDVHENKPPTLADIIEVGKGTISLNSDVFLNKIKSQIESDLKIKGVPETLAIELAQLAYNKASHLVDSLIDDPYDFGVITRIKEMLELWGNPEEQTEDK